MAVSVSSYFFCKNADSSSQRPRLCRRPAEQAKMFGIDCKMSVMSKRVLIWKKGQYRQTGWQKILHNLNELHMTANFVIKLGIVFIT